MLLRDVDDLQNSALGACAISQFCAGYADPLATDTGTPLPLTFLVLPVVFNRITRQFLQSTQEASGLLTFAAKFTRPPSGLGVATVDGIKVRRGRENLLQVHERVSKFRVVTLNAIAMGCATGLLKLSIAEATLSTDPSASAPHLDSSQIREMLRNARKLGRILRPHTLAEISRALGVAF